MANTIRMECSAKNGAGEAHGLDLIYRALCEKGYDPVNQIAGFLLSGDPTYITGHRDARVAAGRIDREALLEDMVRAYLERELREAC